MTKTEQVVFDRIKDDNDNGRACWRPVGNTKGAQRTWRRGGGYEGGTPSKTQQAAFDRLLKSGAVVSVYGGGHVVAGHDVLVQLAARIDLPSLARRVEQQRLELERAETNYANAAAFIRAQIQV